MTTVAWAIGLVADAIWPVLVLVFAGLFIVHGGRPRLAGLRWIGVAMALWGATELLSWPVRNYLIYDSLYEGLGRGASATYGAITGLLGTLVGVVSWALGGAGALKLARDLAPEPRDDAA